MLKAIITDLDNTVYSVRSIADRLFIPLVDLMEQYRDEIGEKQIQIIKQELMKKPWQKVSEEHHVPDELWKKGTVLLKNLTYDLPMQTYADYQYMKQVNAEKFLVTTGFLKLQESKIKMLNISKDFKSYYIVDPETTQKTKQDVFQEILNQYHLQPDEVLAVGDDPDSEIKFAKALGVITYLFDEKNAYPPNTADYQYDTLAHLSELFN